VYFLPHPEMAPCSLNDVTPSHARGWKFSSGCVLETMIIGWNWLEYGIRWIHLPEDLLVGILMFL
jgi:hypothetical protein